MMELIAKYGPLMWKGTMETMYMTAMSTLFAYVVGLPLGVLLFVTAKGGIMESKTFNSVFGWIINILRSFPFVILMIAIVPLTRMIAGKAYGPTAALVPLVIAAIPFVARMAESSLNEIDPGVIEAAQCMGATNRQIIWHVLLVESIPSLVRGASITTITLIGYSAMAGATGSGGLGDIAIRYGMQRYETDVMVVTIILLVVIVCVIQLAFDLVAKSIDKRNR